MEAGKLRHLITIQHATTSRNAAGEPIHTYANAATGVWAEIRPASATEKLKGQELGHVVTHAITMRYRTDVTAASRIVFGARTFEVMGPPINVEERNVELRLYAKETT